MSGSGARTLRRREDVASAVWQVLAAKGFAGLSIRAVAAALGTSTGSVMHHFQTKQDLTTYAFELLAVRTAERPRREGLNPRSAVRSALLDMLPLDATSQAATRVWVSSWDASLADARQQVQHADRYRTSRLKLTSLVEAAFDSDHDGVDEVGVLTEALHAAALGLAVEAVLDPESYPVERQTAVLDCLLDKLLQKPRAESSSHGNSPRGVTTTALPGPQSDE